MSKTNKEVAVVAAGIFIIGSAVVGAVVGAVWFPVPKPWYLRSVLFPLLGGLVAWIVLFSWVGPVLARWR